MIAFAANSVLSRLALGGEVIDAASFTAIRLGAGGFVLLMIVWLKSFLTRKQLKTRLLEEKNSATSSTEQTSGSWLASLMLFIYAVTFSYAYMSVDTGTGALILFGAVQLTMILLSLFAGTRLHLTEWLGVVTAFFGFTYLVLPDISSPSFEGLLLMTLSGIAWGIYTLKGRDSQNPLLDTTYNFIRTMPLVLVLVLLTINDMHFSSEGILLAVIAGGLTSGIGYTIWYIALTGLTSTQAAVIQLSVPIIAAIGGVIFVSETITARLIISSIVVLGGILMVVLGKYYSSKK